MPQRSAAKAAPAGRGGSGGAIARASELVGFAHRGDATRESGHGSGAHARRGAYPRAVSVLLGEDPRFRLHLRGPGHPERPERLEAVHRGLAAAGLADALVEMEPRSATEDDVARVHSRSLLEELAGLARRGGGVVDADTSLSARSYEAALLAAGAGLEAVRRLRDGAADAAFLALRPPGHHATAERAMGFCLLNNVAVTAAALRAQGERVAVVDYDAHHGNGTQGIFYEDPLVLYVSLHQFPAYPGSGRMDETGAGAGAGTTCNLPLPAGAAGDTYRLAWDEVVLPVVAAFSPTWLLISAGFDAHRADPLCGLGLTSGDFFDLTARLAPVAPPGRRIAFLEGGYDLEALASSAGACVGALAGVQWRPEPSSGPGPGGDVVRAVARRLAGARS